MDTRSYRRSIITASEAATVSGTNALIGLIVGSMILLGLFKVATVSNNAEGLHRLDYRAVKDYDLLF